MSDAASLAVVHRVRKRQRDQAAAAVAEIQAASIALEEQIAQARRHLDAAAIERTRRQSGSIDISSLLDWQRYEMQLDAHRRTLLERKEILDAERARRDAELLRCQQALKAVETLQERHAQRARERAAKLLQSRLDEWSTTRLAMERDRSA